MSALNRNQFRVIQGGGEGGDTPAPDLSPVVSPSAPTRQWRGQQMAADVRQYYQSLGESPPDKGRKYYWEDPEHGQIAAVHRRLSGGWGVSVHRDLLPDSSSRDDDDLYNTGIAAPRLGPGRSKSSDPSYTGPPPPRVPQPGDHPLRSLLSGDTGPRDPEDVFREQAREIWPRRYDRRTRDYRESTEAAVAMDETRERQRQALIQAQDNVPTGHRLIDPDLRFPTARAAREYTEQNWDSFGLRPRPRRR